jgi:hypothetical protein
VHTKFWLEPEGKRLFGIPKHRWEDIRMDLMEMGWVGVDWTHVAHDREKWQALVNTLMNLHVP